MSESFSIKSHPHQDAFADAAEITLVERHEAEMAKLGGFKLAGLWEPTIPFVCDYCGCMVSRGGAATHRGRCKP